LTQGYDARGRFVALREDLRRLWAADDLAHDIMETEALDLDEEVNVPEGAMEICSCMPNFAVMRFLNHFRNGVLEV
jgi:hypothetical protein